MDYLWRVFDVGSGPPPFFASDSNFVGWMFWIPLGTGIENPFEPHIPTGITNHVAWNFYCLTRGDAINILLIRAAIGLICGEKKGILFKNFQEKKNQN